MAIVTFDIAIYQGETFRENLTWLTGTPQAPVDLTGATAKMQIRKTADSLDVLAELSTTNNGLVLGGAAGTITMFIAGTATALFTWEYGVYDLFVTQASGDVVCFARGCVSTTRRVTV